ncbi:MAG: fused MFS/spermidine synthase [Synergistaceae bacterium]|nr:fused MFS/spermidine synthase [Synergistaceae bacterium]
MDYEAKPLTPAEGAVLLNQDEAVRLDTGAGLPLKKGAGSGVSFRLQVTSFFCGAEVMALELTGSRLVAPFFGTSLIVWTALIGVMMTSLCIGNWFGGYLADKRPEGRLLGRILIFSALVTALTAFGGNAVLAVLSELPLNLYVASVLAALIIFTPVSLLLGMASPFIARLAMKDVSSSGVTVGRLSALNAAGSILGTFLGGFVLISLFPSGVILMILASVLAFLSVLVYTASWLGSLLLTLALGGAAYAAWERGLPLTPVGEQIDTAYNHISVVESHTQDGRRVRILFTNPGAAQSLMFLDDPTELVSDYTRFYDLAFHYKPDTKKILMLGGGGYCVPSHILAERNVSFDVVELDPGITETARRYFALKDSPNLRIFHQDARTFVNRAVRDGFGPYDAVFMDVFGSWYSIPFHMTTMETAQRLRDLLAPDGVLITNIISALHGPRSGVFHGIYSAFSRAFPRMMIFPASAPEPQYAYAMQNLMLVALRSDAPPPVPPAPDAHLAMLLSNQWLEPFTPDPKVPAFTDAFAPVERYALAQ